MAQVAVIGCGNIGLRHMRVLDRLGHRVVGVDPSAEAAAHAMSMGFRMADDLDRALVDRVDAVIVATPTAHHGQPALRALQAGLAVFVEKPLAHDEETVGSLEAAAARSDATTMVGCNMRFHGGPRTVKGLIEEGAIGKPLAIMFDLGQYLPDWHPEQDYRRSYSARQDQGGGIILDAVHEIDIAIDMFGAPSSVVCMGGHRSNLDIDTEDVADILLRFEHGLVANIHMDYVQRTYSRRYKVIGEEGTIEWGLPGPVRTFRAKDGSWQEHAIPADELEAMYVRQMEHFMGCVESGRATDCPIEAGARAARVALAARQSMQTDEIIAC